MTSLPSGTVTFLFSDIEGSTRMEKTVGSSVWLPLLDQHNRLLREAFEAWGGAVVKTEGDAFFVAFPTASKAVSGAVAAQSAVGEHVWPADAPIRVRMGIHTGEGRVVPGAHPGTEDYAGIDVNLTARIAAAANGGQIVLSAVAAGLCEAALPPGASLRRIEGVRLKDFEDPRLLVQVFVPVIADDLRPLRSIEARTNLPTQLTTFVGRHAEVEEVHRLLARTRLLTLTGPGGTGKTRLAISLADSVKEEYADGAWFVGLAPIRDPELVPSAVAGALGIREEPGIPIVDTLAEALRPKKALLVLDNFEQVVAGAPAIANLLKTASKLQTVVTSREALRISGEQEYRVPTLDREDAFALFVERARAVRPGFVVNDDNANAVGTICDRLDGLPLAIELAAARLRIFAPQALLARLQKSLELLTGGARDLDERQRTLRGAVAWSHDLLDEDERAVFRRLAVLTGGWTLEAAEAIADPNGTLGLSVLDALASLVDKSLIYEEHRAEETRFRRLAVIGEFALEQLEGAGERVECQRRHTDYFLGLVETAELELESGDPGPWVQRLEDEIHNLRAALTWSLGPEADLEKGLRLVGKSWRFFMHRPRLTEARRWCERLLADPRAAGYPLGRFLALTAAGGLAYWQRDFGASEVFYLDSLAIAESANDPGMKAEALYCLGFISMVKRDMANLTLRCDRAAELFEAVGDEAGHAKARQCQVLVRVLAGELEAAAEYGDQDVAYQRRVGSRFRLADGLTLLAAIRGLLGDFGAAHHALKEALGLYREMQMAIGLLGGVQVAAFLGAMTGDFSRAAILAGAAEAMREQADSGNAPLDVLHLPDPVELAREALGDGSFEAAYAEGRRLSADEALALALDETVSHVSPA